MLGGVRESKKQEKSCPEMGISRFESEGYDQVLPNPYQYMTPNFLLITKMSHNSRGTKKTQIALIKCVRGGQGTKKTRKKLPGNGIFSDLHPSQANIYTYIHIYIDIYI